MSNLINKQQRHLSFKRPAVSTYSIDGTSQSRGGDLWQPLVKLRLCAALSDTSPQVSKHRRLIAVQRRPLL